MAHYRWGLGFSVLDGDGVSADPMWQRCPGPLFWERHVPQCGPEKKSSEGHHVTVVPSLLREGGKLSLLDRGNTRMGAQLVLLTRWPLSLCPWLQQSWEPCRRRGSTHHPPPLGSRRTPQAPTSPQQQIPGGRGGSAARGAGGRRSGSGAAGWAPGGGTGRRPPLIHCNKLFPAR